MYAALLKHEARLQARALASFLGVSLAIYAGGLVLMLLNLPVLSSVGSVVAVVACLLLAISVPALLVQRYYASMYGREGYLTHAIPARHTTLYAAKFSWALAVWLGSIVVVLGMALGFVLTQAVADGGTMADGWSVLTGALAGVPTGPVVFFVGCSLVGIVIYVAQVGWIVTFGMEERFRSLGLGGPVLVWFLSYAVLQVLALLAMVAIPLGISLDFSHLVFASFLAELPAAFEGADPSFVPLGWLPMLLATLPVYVVWTLRSLRNHTSLR